MAKKTKKSFKHHKKQKKLSQNKQTEKPDTITPTDTQIPKTPLTNIIWACVFIVIAGFAVYINSLNGQFVWDDIKLVRDNLLIRDISKLLKLFITNIRAGVGQADDFFRPVQMATYMLDYAFWQLDVKGYHLTNIIIHILAALSVFGLLFSLYKNLIMAFTASMLFLVHPVHTESICYIAGRADMLVALFTILALTFYVKYNEETKLKTLILMILCYAGALFSKEYALILPALALLYHYTFKKPLKKQPFLWIIGLTIAYVIYRKTFIPSQPSPEFPSPSFPVRFPGVFVGITEYLRLMPVPLNLHMEYGGKLFPFFYPKALIGLVLTLLLLIVSFNKKGPENIFFFSVYWFFLSLIPQSNLLIPLNAYMAEHWLYVPIIGFVLILAKIFSDLYENKKIRPLAVIGIIMIFLFFAGLTIRQNRVWRTPAALYEHTLRYAPESARVTSNLGIIYYKQGRKEEAIELFKKAIAIDPKYMNAYNNLGNAYRKAGHHKAAIALYKKVQETRPDDSTSYNNIGTVYYDIKDFNKALAAFQKAVEIYPYNVKAINNIGLVYYSLSRLGEAKETFQKVISIDPDYGEAYYMLSAISLYEKQMEKAVEYHNKARARGYSKPELTNALKSYQQKQK